MTSPRSVLTNANMLTKALELAARIAHPVTAAIFAAVLALIALIVLAMRRSPLRLAARSRMQVDVIFSYNRRSGCTFP
jgi:hypothetical protein